MEADLHVTNRCNLRCQHCVYASGEVKMNDMTLEDVKKIIPSFQKMRVNEVHITGGEPLLNREIFEIISLLSRSNFIVRIQSNGMYLSEEKADMLIEAGIDQILISIDGLKESHTIFRKNVKSFDAAIEAALTCVSRKIFTRINTVLYKDNLKDIPGLLDMTSKMGIDQHSFFYLTPIGRGKNLSHKILSLAEWKMIHTSILKYAERIGFLHKIKTQDVFHGEDISIEGFDICRKDNCLIMANGEVYSCVFFVGSEYSMGNIHKRNLFDIWQDETFWKKLSAPRELKCANKMCGGGCPGLAYLMTGTINTCDPRCLPDQNLISSCIRKYVETK